MNLDKINRLYTESLEKYGLDPKSVGWTKAGSQQLRFQKLMQVVEHSNEPFTINELGCGYGEMFKYCMENAFKVNFYYGYDISEKMIEAAKNYIISDKTAFYLKSKIETEADYTYTSGIFNVKFEEKASDWENYIHETLLNMAAFSRKGFSFNLLTSYVDYKMEHLYYADPLQFFDFCKKNISKKVSLLHDYDLYEWTICVRK